ncbi:hypothetical protein ACX12L_22745 [Alicycliphilus sp. T452]
MSKDQFDQEPALQWLYGIRVLIRHPTLSVKDINACLNAQPTYSWNFDDPGKSDTMWSLVNWTEGGRYFFEEIDHVLGWLEDKVAFVQDVRAAVGGKIVIIAQLSGEVNIGDELSLKTMGRAVALGVNIGVEVFPNLRKK